MDSQRFDSWYGKRVVVCDEGLTLLLMGRLLPQVGLTIAGMAACGNELIELVRRERPDLIITDIHVPDMHGSEVIERLRAVSPACLVLLTTDSVSAADATVKTQVSGILHKPLDGATLLTLLRDVWERYEDTLQGAASVQAIVNVPVKSLPSKLRDMQLLFDQATKTWETTKRWRVRLETVRDCSRDLRSASQSLRVESRILRQAKRVCVNEHRLAGCAPKSYGLEGARQLGWHDTAE